MIGCPDPCAWCSRRLGGPELALRLGMRWTTQIHFEQPQGCRGCASVRAAYLWSCQTTDAHSGILTSIWHLTLCGRPMAFEV